MQRTAAENKKEFIELLEKYVKRDGIENLITYLDEQSDFFTSPASTKYHGSYEGGLVEHSLNVYYSLLDEMKFIYGNNWTTVWSLESVAIVGLLHDLCKAGRYKKGFRNVKNENGTWETKEVYEYRQDSFRMGHAALSLNIIQKFIILTDEEAQAIYWHMGAFDTSQYSSPADLSAAFSSNTLAFALHQADMIATHIVENENFKPVQIES